ncbi:MAG: hypothetical protein ABFD92_00820 [Planctomycetaceae bacterium]|nr:hypothetical protein [Planctomycetaceae bacterium]
MVIASHIIMTGYGHWLPNDPRGSLSRELREVKLAPLGEIHFGRKAIQPTREQLRAFHKAAKEQLEHPILWFEQPHRAAIAQAIAQVVQEDRLTCYACAILPNHVHLLIRRHRQTPQVTLHRLRTLSRELLRTRELCPHEHPIWSADAFTLYKDSIQQMRTCIAYIDGNPPKHRLPPQRWDFAVPYDNWPFHKLNSSGIADET